MRTRLRGGLAKTGQFLAIVVAIVLAVAILNQVPGWWHTLQTRIAVYYRCMDAQPPSDTVMEWFEHIHECQEATRGKALSR